MYISREKLTKFSLLVAIFIVGIAVISVILSGVSQFKVGSQLASVQQVSNLSHVLVRQQANSLSLLLVKNSKNDDLVEALDQFARENFVIDAHLYSPAGVLIAQSENATSLKRRLTAENASPTQQIVEPIFVEHDLLGFLRVTFDAHYVQNTQNKVDQLFNQLYAELIILVLVGALLASSLHFYLRRRVTHILATEKLTVSQNKTQTQRFHSRRRNFQRK